MEPLDKPERLRQLSRLEVELVYDTADYPLPAGVRRRDVTSRHLLYRAGDLCLDLRVERDPRSSLTALVGQLANADEPLEPLAGVPVFIMAGERVLARANSNRMGEFQLECEGEASMSLCLQAGDERFIELPVDRRTTKRSAQ